MERPWTIIFPKFRWSQHKCRHIKKKEYCVFNRTGGTCTNWIAKELLPTERKPMRATFRCFVWAIFSPFYLCLIPFCRSGPLKTKSLLNQKTMRATFRCFVWAILPFTLSLSILIHCCLSDRLQMKRNVLLKENISFFGSKLKCLILKW